MEEFIVAILETFRRDVHHLELRLADNVHDKFACFFDLAKAVLAVISWPAHSAEKTTMGGFSEIALKNL